MIILYFKHRFYIFKNEYLKYLKKKKVVNMYCIMNEQALILISRMFIVIKFN